MKRGRDERKSNLHSNKCFITKVLFLLPTRVGSRNSTFMNMRQVSALSIITPWNKLWYGCKNGYWKQYNTTQHNTKSSFTIRQRTCVLVPLQKYKNCSKLSIMFSPMQKLRSALQCLRVNNVTGASTHTLSAALLKLYSFLWMASLPVTA